MTIEQVALHPTGTKFYVVENGRVMSYWLIGKHPKGDDYLLMSSTLNVQSVKVFYIPRDTNLWQVSYEAAKEIMWNEYIAEGKSIDRIFFNNAKNFMNEPTANSTLDDGTGIPSVDQGEIQGDSEVQQRNDRQGSGDSNVAERPGCDGEVLRIKVPDGFGKGFDITQ